MSAEIVSPHGLPDWAVKATRSLDETHAALASDPGQMAKQRMHEAVCKTAGEHVLPSPWLKP